MAQCPDTIKKLIDRYVQQSDTLRSPDYNETLIRVDFINPLMSELGWDINNHQGFAEQYREVVHEDRVRVAGQTKAPDYSFRVGGQRKFFLEAKKPAVDIKNNWEPAYQLRRYAWSAKLACSLLTDFEEFAIYDARIQPRQMEKASVARREYIRYTEYPERWDFLAGTFSKDAVLKGEFDRYCDSKKGRGAQLFDDAFLGEIEEWRKSLASSLARHNESLDESALNFSVQRIIDRIIFLRIAEDRGTETIGQLQALLNGEQVYPRLCKLFRDADARYNSGLFHFSKEKDRDEAPDTLTPALEVDDKTLKSILRALYYPQSPYEFTMVSADILGSVYERFLGKVITLTTGHHAKIEEKPEVRKAGGVYYTPTYIVDYIVKNTVGKLLEQSAPLAPRSAGVSSGETPAKPGDNGKIPALKILDPACGSGSFLIGAYQFLLDWYHTHYTAADPLALTTGKKPLLRPTPAGGYALTIAERKRILIDHIHGVDLDGQAVEVTKLNLLLKCLEGETSQTLGFEQRLFRERALPDLGHNILCGNSLIGTDIIGTEAWNAMSEEERRRINPFDYERAFPRVFKEKDGGFDAVIGNPPYINMLTLDKLQPKPIKAYWSKRFSVAAGAYDIYILFFEQGERLLRSGGALSYIVPNKFLAAEYAIRFREWISNTWRFESVVDFSRVKVWKKASVYPIVPTFKKVRTEKEASLQVLKAVEQSASSLEALADVPFEHLNGMPDRLWSFVTRDGAKTLLRLIGECTPLEEVAEVWGASTVAEGDTYPPLIRSGASFEEPHARFLVSGAVERYHTTWATEEILFTKRKYFKPLIKLGPPMTLRRQAQARSPKIVICKVALRPRALLDVRGEYLGAYTTYVMDAKVPLQYLTAVINSRLMAWAYELLYDALAMSGGYLRFQPPQIRRLPIPTKHFADNPAAQTKIEDLVNALISQYGKLAAEQHPQHRERVQREIDATDRQIDQLVYQLYGLTEAEIAIVENATAG